MKRRVSMAIVGVGPRGLFAFEQLLLKVSKIIPVEDIKFILFDHTGGFGYGPVYNISQNQHNWININERILTLPNRSNLTWGGIKVPAFPTYHEWANIDIERIPEDSPDTYPPRAKVGKYLSERFHSLSQPLIQNGIAYIYIEKVRYISKDAEGRLTLMTPSNQYTNIDDVLITVGHQPTEPDEQLANWLSKSTDSKAIKLYENPYPVAQYLYDDVISPKTNIGIRGFGLAMIDVVRSIASKLGEFTEVNKSTQKCTYQSSKHFSGMLIPFSLDGLPQVPKPINAKVDNLYKPSEDKLVELGCILGSSSKQSKATSARFIIEAITPIILEIYINHHNTYSKSGLSDEDLKSLIIKWLLDENTPHKLFLPHGQFAKNSMEQYVQMACGIAPISLDFCIGQVWRHCQPTIYEKLSHNKCNEEVFAEIIHLDERLKRYTFGPPVESIQQLLALVEAGVLNLDFVKDPEVELKSKGWQLTKNGKSITVSSMINSILDAPRVKNVSSLLVKNLLAKDYIEAVHDDFGIATKENAYIISKDNNEDIPMALLGRLAKGTIIGTDAILECFGERPKNWASAAAIRINLHLRNTKKL